MSSKTVLFAWELGEGLGHLPPLKAIAMALAREGVRPVFALRDPVQTRAVLSDLNAVILPAPFWADAAPPSVPSGTYADILAGNGYGSAASIKALLGAWDAIVDLVRPDLIVCEHAPTVALSAFGRIPVAMVGNGFVVPPADGDAFPPFEAGKGDAGRQQAVLTAIQDALGQLARKIPDTIVEPFRGAFRGVYTFPVLDPYRQVRQDLVLGPIEPVPELQPPPTKPHLFAYLAANNPAINDIMQALMDLGRSASVFCRGSLGARAAVLASRGVTIYETAPALPDILPKASAVFSHGGTGISHAALAAGRPHIVSPRHLEALITGRRIEELGAGVLVHPFEPERFREALMRAQADSQMRAAHSAGAAARAFVKTATPVEATVAALRQMLT